ncbi:MAG: recombination protein RecA [Puniceicoccaceae bacterium 5H]|nr:MAG: recombination protein RecA [Puniceicoccaceae bacterium 5H]
MARTSKTTPAPAADSKKALDLALSAITKQFGEGTVMRLGEATKLDVQVIPSGCPSVDLALGVGGLPRGRVCEVYGPESSGKTTLCLALIAQAQRMGGNAVFIDVEHALDPRYARVVGVDVDNLMVSQPESGEDALNITETLIRSGAIDIIVIDSVAALVSKNELDGQFGDSTVGLQARMMSQAMRRLTGAISRTRCVCLFTNQIREKIGVMFGNPETQPGGRALKFAASVRMDIRRIGQIKDTSGKVTGNRTRLKVVKNKVAPPFTECEFDIMYNEGISRTGSVLDLGIDYKILEKKGSWISYDGNLLGQGREAAKQFLMENPETMEAVTKAIYSNVQVTGGASLATGAAGDDDDGADSSDDDSSSSDSSSKESSSGKN